MWGNRLVTELTFHNRLHRSMEKDHLSLPTQSHFAEGEKRRNWIELLLQIYLICVYTRSRWCNQYLPTLYWPTSILLKINFEHTTSNVCILTYIVAVECYNEALNVCVFKLKWWNIMTVNIGRKFEQSKQYANIQVWSRKYNVPSGQ